MKKRIYTVMITDSDIATIEALHDLLLDNHGYSIGSEVLKKSRKLVEKIHNSEQI